MNVLWSPRHLPFHWTFSPVVRRSLAALKFSTGHSGDLKLWLNPYRNFDLFEKGTWQSREPRGLGSHSHDPLWLWHQVNLWVRPPLLIPLWILVSLLKNQEQDYWPSFFAGPCHAMWYIIWYQTDLCLNPSSATHQVTCGKLSNRSALWFLHL